MNNVMDVAYDLNNTPTGGVFYEVSSGSWYITSPESIMNAVDDVWYSRIVWYGVNDIGGALPPNNSPAFVFSMRG